MAEAGGLNPLQHGFESHRGHCTYCLARQARSARIAPWSAPALSSFGDEKHVPFLLLSAARGAIRVLIASLAKLALSNGSLRSLRCSLGAAVFVEADKRLFQRTSSALEAFRRLLLQIGGANIAGRGSRLGARLLCRRSGTKNMSPFSPSVRRVARSGFDTGRALLNAPPRRF